MMILKLILEFNMRVDKIKAINREIEETLKTNPGDFLKNRNTLTRFPNSVKIPELECSLCHDVKRQNYKLKQEMFEMQEKCER